jgi:protein tyrosine/serine phosphatase
MPTNPPPFRLRSHAAALLVVLLAVSGGARAADPPASTASAATNLSAVRIDNFGRVDANVYRGAQPQGRDYADLKALGVQTIVNLTSDDAEPDEKAMAEAAGMRYVHIPMTTHIVPTPEQLSQFLAIANDSEGGAVFVHCVGGRHRTGVMTAAYRMTHEGWTADRAFNEMKQYGFGADFLHTEFKQFVYSYRPSLVTPATLAVAAAASPTTSPAHAGAANVASAPR